MVRHYTNILSKLIVSDGEDIYFLERWADGDDVPSCMREGDGES